MNSTADDAPRTLRGLAGLAPHHGPLAGAALVIIDAQQEYSPSGQLTLPGLDPAVANIRAVLDAVRRTSTAAIHVAHRGDPGRLFAPEAGGAFLRPLAPAGQEAVVHKTLPNAFAGTELEATLLELGCTHLVLAGFMTHMCVSATARAALDLGFETTVLSDATATRSLPSPTANTMLTHDAVHEATLAALADRFSVVETTAALLDRSTTLQEMQ